jgi:glyoxylase-like metal-dependent hydrolase (beta-lactamase superfamily II)
MQNLQIGHERISIINIGDIVMKLKETENVSESEWRAKYSNLFDTPLFFPSQCVYFHDNSTLVDAGEYDAFREADPNWIPKGYVPPPGLLEQLREAGVRPGDVKRVIITHIHFDHHAGATRKQHQQQSPPPHQEEYVPSFPNARYYLGRDDWFDPSTKEQLKEPKSQLNRTLGVIEKLGLLELVSRERIALTPELEVIHAPGESPGHQLVRFRERSGAGTFYCLGDLFHHAVEVENPTWMAQWDDPEKNLRSRNALIDEALLVGDDGRGEERHALLLAAHMPLGKLERQEEMDARSGVRFVEV